MGVVGMAIQGALTEFSSGLNVGISPEQQVAHDNLMKTTQHLMPFTAALLLLDLAVSAGLVVGGVMTLGIGNALARKVLTVAFIGCIIHDLLKGVLAVVNAYLMQGAMEEWNAALAQDMPSGSPNMDGLMDASMWLGLGFSISVALLFIAYEVCSLLILRYWGEDDDYEGDVLD